MKLELKEREESLTPVLAISKVLSWGKRSSLNANGTTPVLTTVDITI